MSALLAAAHLLFFSIRSLGTWLMVDSTNAAAIISP
jgi:hypothetical protein